MKDTILFGNCQDTLKEFAPKSARTCVTSPPYYGLRDYGTATWIGGDPNCNHRRDSKVKPENCNTGHKNHDEMYGVGDAIYKTVCPKCGAIRQDSQIGLEETPEEYIESLVSVFRGVRDVLTDDGTLWVNLGDSYYNYRPGKGQSYPKQTVSKTKQDLPDECNKRGNKLDGLKEKDLIGIPWLFAFAMRADGWYLRQDIIWHKPNPMPESVRDRCTKSHEYIFLFSKNRKYYSNSITIELPVATNNSIELVKTAISGLGKIYKYGYFYQKAGVILSKLRDASEKELNLLAPILENKSQPLMRAIDFTNAKYGRNAISIAQAGISNDWKMRREHSSRIDTASFDFLPKINI